MDDLKEIDLTQAEELEEELTQDNEETEEVVETKSESRLYE